MILIYNAWSSDPKYGTGVAVTFLNLIKELKNRKIKFIYLTNNFKYKTFTGFVIKRIIHNYLMKWKFKKLKPEIILGFDFDGVFCPRDIKYILNLRTNFSEIKKYENGIMKLFCLIEEFFQKKAVKRADKVIVASNYTKESVIKNYNVENFKLVVIPNGVDKKTFFNSKINCTKENLVLSVSTLYPRKGIYYLIKALEQLKLEGIKFKHIHIGDGVLKKDLLKLIKSLKLENDVGFVGSIGNRKKLAAIYRRSKVFCHPSLQEDFGNVFLEAMASGVPIIAFKNSAAKELVKDKENGFLVVDRDVKDFTEKLRLMLTNDCLNSKIGNNNLKAAKKYSWKKTTQRFISVLKEQRLNTNK